jgi:formamidopyrimidine-DNA glycosylase
MPELPEVETTVRGLRPHVVGEQIERIVLRRGDLRWPIPREVLSLRGERVVNITRRAKYIVMQCESAALLWHLGMSGTMRVVPSDAQVRTHDHVDLVLGTRQSVRLNDPRRFGCLLWHPNAGGAIEHHPRLRGLGPEPLGEEFHGAYLFEITRKRTQAIKTFVMDQKHVVGVGNIYAAEALFATGIRPARRASKLTRAECDALVLAIQSILNKSIARGGTPCVIS